MKKSQHGFAVLESLLILVIVAIIGGTGYFVWHSKQQTDKTLDNTSNSSTSTSAATSTHKSSSSTDKQKYFTISQWGIRAPYNGGLTLEYSIKDGGNSPAVATLSSAQLDATSTICADKTYGGQIDRYRSTDMMYFGGTISNQAAKDYAATLDKSDYGHVGNYYYFFEHAQAACGDSDASLNLQTQTSNDVKGLLPSLQAVPQ